MQDIQLYQQILGATDPWRVKSVFLNQKKQAIEVDMALKNDPVWACPTTIQ